MSELPSSGAPVDTAGPAAFGYDANGKLTSDGSVSMVYDALNRVTQKTVPASASGAAGYSVFYGYDLRDLQTYARFGSASGAGVTNSYDAFGRLASSSSNMGGTARTLSYLYDAGSRRTRLTFPDGAFFAYEHDAAGNLTAVRENGGTVVASFSYNSAGLVSGQSVSGAATAYGYDSIFRLASIGHDLAGAGADQTLGFAYNPASQIIARTSANAAYASTTAYLVADATRMERMIADRGYDANKFRATLKAQDTIPVIPGRCNRKRPIQYDQRRYKDRWRIEAMFCRLKDFRRVATRYDKLARNFLSAVHLAAAIAFWL